MLIRLLFLFLFAIATIVALTCPSLHAEEAVEIPLSEIWALNMPGTRPMSASMHRDGTTSPEYPLLRELLPSLQKWPREEKDTGKGIAVLGKDMTALKNAHAVRVLGERVQHEFPSGSEISLFFFSYESTAYVYLKRVERKDNSITITYHFVPHDSDETTVHFALIPFGELPPGDYSVEVQQAAMEKEYTDLGFATPPASVGEQLVCRSFQFSVAE